MADLAGSHQTTDDLSAMRRRLFRNLLVLSLVTSGAILAVTMLLASRARAEVSKLLVKSSTDHVEAELDAFFREVRRSLRVAADWGAAGLLDPADPEAVTRRLAPMMQRHPQVSSLMVADGTGREVMVLHTGDEWRNRVTDLAAAGDVHRVRRWADGGVPPATWETSEFEYDPTARPWFRGALDAGPQVVHWTEPGIFFTTKERGITASVSYPDPRGSAAVHVVAFDVLLDDISRVTQELRPSDRGRVVVVAGDVPGRGELDVLTSLGGLDPRTLEDARREADVQSRDVPDAWSFDSGGERWWGGMRPFRIGRGTTLYIAAVVPEADLLAALTGQVPFILSIAAVSLLAAAAVALVLDRAFRARLTRAVDRARTLGQYTLEERLGEGGMGAVYRARHAMLRRPTAVKLLKPDRTHDEVSLRRFEKEVQVTAALTHPNTIAIYDYGRTPDGVFYYAMEYLDGVSLEDLVAATGRLSPARVVHVLRQVCGSLDEAHRSGLVHRDVKPANIVLCERGGALDVVKVLDFGLVKAVAGATDPGLTREGAIAGTPLYISPEAIMNPESVDGRSDLYSLGAVGYFLLTGRPVFDVRSVGEAVAAHVGQDPERPSVRVGHPLPEDLEDLLGACLAKSQENRPASAAEMIAVLDRCAESHPWTRQDARAWWNEHGAALRKRRDAARTSDRAGPGPLTIDLGSRQG